MKYYAGIGSRAAPKEILELCFNVGLILAKYGYILRSGHADGCDIAFEDGCDAVNGEKQIFLPWKNFNGSSSYFYFKNSLIPEKIKQITMENYLKWYNVTTPVKLLHARNTQQILGVDLNEPVDFVVGYTNRPPFVIGGTRYGMYLAEKNHIPIYNFFDENDLKVFKSQ